MAKNIISDLRQIFKASVSAVSPENLLRKSISYNSLSQRLSIGNRNYNLRDKNLYIVGVGKAAQNMAIEVEKTLGSKIKQGIISIPVESLTHKPSNDKIMYYEGAENNIPNIQALETAIKVKDLVRNLTHNDFLLVILSGGGSALLPSPKEPVKLQEKVDLIKKLANAGADIKELNTVRKRISDVKGGQLAILAQPAQVATLVLSDIVGDPIDLIASGPTVKNEDDLSAAKQVLNKYNLYDELPESIKTILECKENPKVFPDSNVQNLIIGSNKLSTGAASSKALKLNYYPIELSNTIAGNINDIAIKYVELVKHIAAFRRGFLTFAQLKSELLIVIPEVNKFNFDEDSLKRRDLCLILGGETTVNVKGSGLGGRNQQLCMEFSRVIHNYTNELNDLEIYILSAGTDGIDGPTDAAGAIGYLNLIKDCQKANINIDEYIESNDSYNFFKQIKNGELHVITGHTHTNVMDIHLIMIKTKK